jgi:CDGSH-type Zn-finger protein
MERKSVTNPNSLGRVAVSRDGPYIVTGKVPLVEQIIATAANGDAESWREGKTIQLHEGYALCRCGQSKKKPICDGTHIDVGFDGTETASRETYLKQAQIFDGPALLLADAKSLCAFGRFCDPNGKVWNQVARTDDPHVRKTFLRQVGNCPSGRLVAVDKVTGSPMKRNLPVSIGLVEDPEEQCSGPLWLRGGIAVISADGFEYELRDRVTLCRCGQSANKPFCDGTHASVKFRADR